MQQRGESRPRDGRTFDPFVAWCVAHGIPEPEREVAGLVPGRRFVIDYAWPERMLCLECEGGVWNRGKHGRGSGIIKDMEKNNALVRQGYKLLRYTPTQLTDGTALEDLIDLVIGGLSR